MPFPLSPEDREDLVAYLDGELRGPRAAALEAKLNQDPNVRAEAESLRQTWELLDYLPRSEPSPEMVRTTMTRISTYIPASADRRGSHTWLRYIGWLAAAFLAGIAGFTAVHLVPHRGAAPDSPPALSADEAMVRDLSVLENQRLYQHVDDIGFLQHLADPNEDDLFGKDAGL
jgi:anti-sigma factor RsiW